MSQTYQSGSEGELETSRASRRSGSGVDRLPHPLPRTHVDESKRRNLTDGNGSEVDNASAYEGFARAPPPADVEAGQPIDTGGVLCDTIVFARISQKCEIVTVLICCILEMVTSSVHLLNASNLKFVSYI